MLIVLDTNVLLADPLMRKGGFQILVDYANRTESRIILPRLVFEELVANYSRSLAARIGAQIRAVEELNGLIPDQPIVAPVIDIEKSVKEYTTHVRSRLGITDSSIQEYTEANLRDAINRAITRRRPCTESGQEVRDALLWNNVLDIAAKPEADVVFISRNIKQFALNEKLHPDLKAELDAKGLQIDYLTSLEEFGRKHASQIAFITLEWIAQHIDGDEILDEARDTIVDGARRALNYLSVLDIQDMTDFEVRGGLDVDEYFVYLMENGDIRLTAHWFGYPSVGYTARGADHYGGGVHTFRSELEMHVSVTTEAVVRGGEVVEMSVVDKWAEDR